MSTQTASDAVGAWVSALSADGARMALGLAVERAERAETRARAAERRADRLAAELAMALLRCKLTHDDPNDRME